MEKRSNSGFQIKGDELHPANQGRLCSKGAALGETLSLPNRLLYPEIDGQRVSWDEALDAVAEAFSQTLDQYGPDALACYVSGQLLTEDYYVVNKWVKGFLGTANIDTNSRLCMSTAVAGHKRAFGADIVPTCYEDLELADLVILCGWNAAWTHPVLYRRMEHARRHSNTSTPRRIVIDTRSTETAQDADLFLQINPGADAWLFNGLLHYLAQSGAIDQAYMDAHTNGSSEAFAAAQETAGSAKTVAKKCGISEAQVMQFFEYFSQHEKVVTAFCQGINQSSSGVDKVNTIINCHLATGRIGKPGSGPFSITGQPNAMGGREVGGLANQLASHTSLSDPHARYVISRFWKARSLPEREGLKAVDMFRAVGEGKIKAIWIMGTNPAVSMPNVQQVREALKNCPMTIVSDCMSTSDTVKLARIRLPAAAWGEKSGTVTNSERCISRQRNFLPLPGQARPDWWMITQVARRMGFLDGFNYSNSHEIFREHAVMSGMDFKDNRQFNISGLSHLNDESYNTLAPIQWPVSPDGSAPSARMFGDGRFCHPDAKAQMIAVTPQAPVSRCDEDFPLILNTGRLRDQWHTMMRTGFVPRLTEHFPEPCLSVHPDDVQRYRCGAGDLVIIESSRGDMLAKVIIDTGQQPGSVFAPMHWNDAFARKGTVGSMIAPIVDPISGQPESKQTAVRIKRFPANWYGVVFTRQLFPMPPSDYHIKVAGSENLWRLELAGIKIPDWSNWKQRWALDGDWVEYSDVERKVFRGALVKDNSLQLIMFSAPRSLENLDRKWLTQLFSKPLPDKMPRFSLLTGVPSTGAAPTGKQVCACFGVDEASILDVIRKFDLTDETQVGERIKAGTNCGSCLPTIRRLLERSQTVDQVE